MTQRFERLLYRPQNWCRRAIRDDRLARTCLVTLAFVAIPTKWV